MNQMQLQINNIEDLKKLANMFVQSGLFQDSKDLAKACVRILAGAEMGIPPFTSMTGIGIINDRPAVHANLMASKIKGSGKYDFIIIEHTDEKCILDFYQNGKKIGFSKFDLTDAAKAGLLGKDNWKKYPRNMLFARAISNGLRWYCPDALNNIPVYTPDELDHAEDESGNPKDVAPKQENKITVSSLLGSDEKEEEIQPNIIQAAIIENKEPEVIPIEENLSPGEIALRKAKEITSKEE